LFSNNFGFQEYRQPLLCVACLPSGHTIDKNFGTILHLRGYYPVPYRSAFEDNLIHRRINYDLVFPKPHLLAGFIDFGHY
jgi:hypothetical protein